MENNNYKLGILFNFQSSTWISCNSILTNLLESYKQTNLNNDQLLFHDKMTLTEISNLAIKIIENEYTHLAFIDHRTLPNLLLLEIFNLTQKLPTILIHIYGDFILNRKHWHDSDNLLRNFKVKFICASTAQSTLVKNFINLPQSDLTLSTIPFPVSSTFNFTTELRATAREQYKLNEEDLNICYTGRISLQKNVLDLITNFSFVSELIPNAKLFLAGSFDDIGVPYIGLNRRPLTMEYEFYLLIEKLPQHIKNKIFYVGHLQEKELIKFYHAADLYISYSTHNDEDFGMSPAEAICLGLPLVLSNWGGFADFKKNLPKLVDLVRVEIGHQHIKPSKDYKKIVLKKLLKNNFYATEDRIRNSKLAKSFYDINIVSNLLKKLILAETELFPGFNSFFYSTILKTDKHGPFQSEKDGYSVLYSKLYDCYLNKGLQ